MPAPAGSNDLASRLQMEIDQAKGQVAALHSQTEAKSKSLRDRYTQFEAIRSRLAGQFETRIKTIMEKVKDVKMDKERTQDTGEVRLVMGHTELIPPAVTLRFVLSHDGAVEKLAIDYYLSIIPVMFEFRPHDRFEAPLNALDDAKVLAWVDDRIVEFTKVYLTIPFIDAYNEKNRVTDPVAKVNFNKLMAKGTIEHKGKTYHFASEDSMTQFKREPDKYAKA